jgi:hypothetical protein
VRRDARKQVEAVQGMYRARLEARGGEISALRDSFDKGQLELAAPERRARYLESAIATTVGQVVTGRTADSPTQTKLSSA